jgi:hypothetical protein
MSINNHLLSVEDYAICKKSIYGIFTEGKVYSLLMIIFILLKK